MSFHGSSHKGAQLAVNDAEVPTVAIGLDVHALSVRLAAVNELGELLDERTLPNDHRSVERAVAGWPGARVCYRVGSAGFALCRHLRAAGVDCVVVAPSNEVSRSGNGKTGSCDARGLAALHARGRLEAIFDPGPELEAIRDLIRGTERARSDRTQARNLISDFLLRHERTLPTGSWEASRPGWLALQRFEQPAEQEAFEHCLQTLDHADEQLASLEEEVRRTAERDPFRELVSRLRRLQGIDTLSALGIVAGRNPGPLADPPSSGIELGPGAHPGPDPELLSGPDPGPGSGPGPDPGPGPDQDPVPEPGHGPDTGPGPEPGPASRESVTVLDAVRRRPWAVAIPVVLLVALAVLAGLSRTPTYTADTSLSVGRFDVSSASLPGFASAIQSLSSAYARLIGADAVVDPVARELRVSPRAVVANVSATPIPDSPLLNVEATAPTSARALKLSSLASDSLVNYISADASQAENTTTDTTQYRDLLLALSQAELQQKKLTSAYNERPGAAVRGQLDQVSAQIKVLQLHIDAIHASAVSTPAIGAAAGIPSVIVRPRAAVSDRTPTLERYGFIGLAVGAVLGVAFALLLARRRVGRSPPGELTPPIGSR